MNEKISSQIEHHQFVEEVVKDITLIFKKSNGDKDYILSEFEQYSMSIFKWAMRIRGCFETLEHARAYLSHFRTNKWYKEAGIGRSDYINYHYFNYAVTVVKAVDVALILTDRTFRLGNPERFCRVEAVSENLWVKSAGVNKLLKELDTIVNPWREPRHLFVHRGETIDREPMHLLEAYDFLMEEDALPIEDMPSRAKYLYQSEVSRISEEFKETEKSLFKAISELFAGLLPIYKFWRKLLEQTPKV
jgi:hypothetical protein